MSINKPRRPRPTKKTLASLRMAVKFFGGLNSDLAKAIGVSNVMVSRWRSSKTPISIRCAALIEKKTKGSIKAIDLIPDLG